MNIIKRLTEKWDLWIYHKFHKSIKRICAKQPGWSYVMELHLRDFNKDMDSTQIFAAECFYKTWYKQDIPEPTGFKTTKQMIEDFKNL